MSDSYETMMATMAREFDPQAVNDPAHPLAEQTSPFFKLPAEIRNVIYEYALVEPALHDRTHRDGCRVVDKTKHKERPVFRTTLEARREHVGASFDKTLSCVQTCQGHAGLPLLRTCKEIYAAALPLFLASNTFTFTSIAAFTRVAATLPHSVRARVRSLAIITQYSGAHFDPHRHLYKTLRTFRNLEELSLPAYALRSGLALQPPDLPHLRVLRSVHLTRIGYLCNWAASVLNARLVAYLAQRTVYIRQEHAITLPTDRKKAARDCQHSLAETNLELSSAQPLPPCPKCGFHPVAAGTELKAFHDDLQRARNYAAFAQPFDESVVAATKRYVREQKPMSATGAGQEVQVPVWREGVQVEKAVTLYGLPRGGFLERGAAMRAVRQAKAERRVRWEARKLRVAGRGDSQGVTGGVVARAGRPGPGEL